ncbi:conserved hypothetical protein [Arthrobacter sp. Hiyo4]|nr:conserved hypothetical protein [Arthrobacter sp. Hiyo4]
MTGALITTVVGLTGLGGGFWGWSRNGFGGFLWTVFWVGGAIYFIYYLTQRSKARNGAPMNATPQPAGGDSGYSASYPTTPYAAPFAATDSASTRTSGTSGSAPHLPVPPSSVNPPYGGGSYGGGGSDGGAYGGYQPPQGPARHPRSALPARCPAVAITAGTALLVGGGLKALDAGNVINLGDAPTRSSGPAAQPSWAWASSSRAFAAGRPESSVSSPLLPW